MTNINAYVLRDGKWWIAEFTVDGKEYGTQARRLDKISDEVADAASLMTGQPAQEFQVTLTAANEQWATLIAQYKETTEALTKAQEATRTASRRAVDVLQKSGLSGREIASLLGISPQRVSQLTA